MRNGDGVAAVMRDKYWDKKTASQRQGLHLIYKTNKPYPHRAFSVSSRVDVTTRNAIEKALMSEDGIQSRQAVLQRFRSKQFLPAKPQEYVGLEALLKPVWGYRIQ